jgi:hypothetical protein
MLRVPTKQLFAIAYLQCCMHSVLLIADNTIVGLCCPALPCPALLYACAIGCHSLVACALQQQHQVSVGVAFIG